MRKTKYGNTEKMKMADLIERMAAWFRPAPTGKKMLAVRVYEDGRLVYRESRSFYKRNELSPYAVASQLAGEKFQCNRRQMNRARKEAHREANNAV